MDFFQNTCFKDRNNMTVGKAIKVTINFYKKQNLLVITWNKKYLSKQVMSITYTLEKTLLAAATFVSSFFSERVKKNCSILWSA